VWFIGDLIWDTVSIRSWHGETEVTMASTINTTCSTSGVVTAGPIVGVAATPLVGTGEPGSSPDPKRI
jgi:hypothetical protein